MNDFRCGAKFCTRCALSFGLGYQDIEPGRPIDNPLPLAMGAHDEGVPSKEFDVPPLDKWQGIAEISADSSNTFIGGAPTQQALLAGSMPPGWVETKVRFGLPTDYDARKRLRIWTFLTQYFPDAFLAVVEVAVQGNEQHNKGEPLHWAREKSTDQMDTAARHMFDHSTVGPKDTDGCWHLAKAIWRLSAELQLLIEGSTTEGKSDEH